nr:predicted GPI-anchored protein 58 [Aegilops tauschii subsp. strangulata]
MASSLLLQPAAEKKKSTTAVAAPAGQQLQTSKGPWPPIVPVPAAALSRSTTNSKQQQAPVQHSSSLQPAETAVQQLRRQIQQQQHGRTVEDLVLPAAGELDLPAASSQAPPRESPVQPPLLSSSTSFSAPPCAPHSPAALARPMRSRASNYPATAARAGSSRLTPPGPTASPASDYTGAAATWLDTMLNRENTCAYV